MSTNDPIGVDFGDLYATTFDLLSTTSRSGPTRYLTQEQRPGFFSQVEQHYRFILRTGEMPDALLGDHDLDVVYLRLQTLYKLLLAADPRTAGGAGDPALEGLTGRLTRTGRFNATHELGAVMPRYVLPGRPSATQASLSTRVPRILRVPAQDWAKWAGQLVVAGRLDMGVRNPTPGRFLVGGVGMLGDLGDVDVELAPTTTGGRFYAIRPTSATHDRVERILANLDASGVRIGVLPELTLDDEHLDLWRQNVLTTERPAGSNLEWLLVGTGPVSVDDDDPVTGPPEGAQTGRRGSAAGGAVDAATQLDAPPAVEEPAPPNRAVLMHRVTGEVIAVQDKQHAFTLTGRQVRDWHLETHLGPGAADEWMRDGTALVIVDSRVGRFAIAICEDITRESVRQAVADLGVSHVFVPIFSDKMHDASWVVYQQAAQMATAGAATVVVNSMAIPDRDGTYGPRHTIGVLPVLSGPVQDYVSSTQVVRAPAVIDPEQVSVVDFGLPPF